MKIAIYIADLDVQGGTHKQVLRLADFLVRQGHTVRLFTPVYHPEKTYPEFSDYDITSLRKNMVNVNSSRLRLLIDLWAQFVLFLKSRKDHYDIINMHDMNTTCYTLLNVFFGKSRLVWQINDIHLAFRMEDTEKCKNKLAPLFLFFTSLAARRVDLITVNVTKNAERVVRYLGAEAKVVYCGVDPLPPRQHYPDNNSVIRIVSTGVVFSFRNYENVIKTASLLQSTYHKNVLVDIIGDMRYEPDYVRQLQGLAERCRAQVTFHGAVSQQRLESLYAQGTVFVFINLDQSWGLAVCEAASCGLPVIVSDSVGVVEIVRNQPGFVVVDPLDAKQIAQTIYDITQNQDKYVALCQSASTSVKNMSWDIMYSAVIEREFLALCSG